jgi:hypothetical protein
MTLSAYIIKLNVPEMGKSDAVVTVDCNLRPRFGQRVCILLVWKLAERPGKYHNAKLSGIYESLKYFVFFRNE